jgi:hypothetical protein
VAGQAMFPYWPKSTLRKLPFGSAECSGWISFSRAELP